MKKNVTWKLLEINVFRLIQGKDGLQPDSLVRDYRWSHADLNIPKIDNEASAYMGKFLQVV